MARYPNAARRVGRLIVTTCRQGGGHPWVDQATTRDADRNAYSSVAIRPSLRPQRHREGGRALVLGWRQTVG